MFDKRLEMRHTITTSHTQERRSGRANKRSGASSSYIRASAHTLQTVSLFASISQVSAAGQHQESVRDWLEKILRLPHLLFCVCPDFFFIIILGDRIRKERTRRLFSFCFIFISYLEEKQIKNCTKKTKKRDAGILKETEGVRILK